MQQAAGMEERKTVMIPPGSVNPFAGETEQPDYVINGLTVYSTPTAVGPARRLIGKYARDFWVVPKGLVLQDRSKHPIIYITRQDELSKSEKAAIRAARIAVIELRDGLTFKQAIQEALAQWQGRTIKKVDRIVRYGPQWDLGIYL
ncbi:MAG: hypothetical protein HY600_05780 [Candidatus Omnitrophica bacterium]|nr:hypothetical protein [Candidatus Omnitrophota bacterium]